MLNAWMAVGRLVDVGETKTLNNGTVLIDFVLDCTEEGYETVLEVSAFNKVVAEVQSLVRGQIIVVRGKAGGREYDDRNGNTRRAVNLKAFSVEVLETGGGPTKSQAKKVSKRTSKPKKPQAQVHVPVEDDDIPF